MPRPWEYPIPHYLHKYFPPDRFHILTDCAVRFSQRQVFDDDRELQPEVAAFGTEAEIRDLIEAHRRERPIPAWLEDATVERIINTPGQQQMLVELSQGRMRTPDQYGVFCMCESGLSEQMWREYAGAGRGFVVVFDTSTPAFSLLAFPGRLGKVEYSDEPIGTFLGSMAGEGAGIFFRKRNRYRFEAEWRSVRALDRLDRSGDGRDAVYSSRFNPNCVAHILIRRQCSIERELRLLIANDTRYRHVSVDFVGE